jgi:MFS family permease
LSRNVFAIGLLSLFSDAGHELTTAILPLFLATLAGSAAALGVIEGFSDAASSVLKLWISFYSDRVGKRKPHSGDWLFRDGNDGDAGLVTAIWQIVLIRMVAWMGRGAPGPVRDALLSESVPAQAHGRAFGFETMMDTLGAVIGPAIALSLVGVIALLILRAVTVLTPSHGAVQAGKIAIGLYIFHNVVYATAAYPVGMLGDRMSKKPLLAVGYALFAVMCLGFLVVGTSLPGLFALFALAGIYIAIVDSMERALAADLLPLERRGTGYGALATVNSVGDLVSSIVVGELWTHVSATAGFSYAAVLTLAGDRTKRLIKAPKIYWGDTGLAMHLAEAEEPGGAHLENLVLHDLLAWRDARVERAQVGYWRTSIGEEVDFVIEAGASCWFQRREVELREIAYYPLYVQMSTHTWISRARSYDRRRLIA